MPVLSNTQRRVSDLVAAALVCTVVGAWYFQRIFLTASTAAIDFVNYDLYAYAYPMLAYWFTGLRDGEFTLWNPYQACGLPLAATENGFFYPLNFLHLMLPTGIAIGYTTVLHFALAGFFQHQFLRARHLAWPACLIGALTFMLMPLFVRTAWFPGCYNTTVWIAGILWACERLVQRPTRGAVAALATALGVQLLAGRSQLVVFGWYFFAPYAVGRTWSVWRHDRQEGRRVAVALMCAVILGGALSAIQIIPETELAVNSMRSTAGISALAAEAYPGSPDIPELWQTLLVLDTERWDPAVIFPPYGWHLIGCAAVAVLLVRRRWVWFFAAVAAIFFVLAAGSHTPLYDVFRRLPTGDWFRVPERMLSLTVFSLSVLSAVGVDALARAGGRARWAVGLLILSSVLIYWQTPAPSVGATTLVTAFASSSVCLLVPAVWVRAPAGVVMAVVLAMELVDIHPATHAHPTVSVAGYGRADAALRRGIARERAPGMRVFYSYRPIHYVPLPKVGLLDGFPTVTDYEPMTLRRFADFAEQLHGGPDDPFGAVVFFGDMPLRATATSRRLLDLTSAQLVVQRGDLVEPDPLLALGLELVDDYGGQRLYRNPGALPRAFVVSQYVLEADERAGLRRLADPRFDPHAAAMLDAPPRLAPASGASGTATLTEDQPDAVTVLVETTADALLVLTDVAYAGWAATVDGRPEPLQRANYLFRAVSVPRGSHEVRFEFHPASFRWGAALSGVSLLTILALLFARHRS
ncbi:MAG: YfhO family protein [Deltaproteobacteria bacterium]|nr:YfhO family protein [Deltaproteobacteria bacterium]MBI3389018.1 YfhO family protein [Deltaproteobacteria bacterium]